MGGPQWHRGVDDAASTEVVGEINPHEVAHTRCVWLQVEMSSFGEKSVEAEWEEVLAPERMAALSHHDAKLLLLALRR